MFFVQVNISYSDGTIDFLSRQRDYDVIVGHRPPERRTTAGCASAEIEFRRVSLLLALKVLLLGVAVSCRG